MSHAHFARAFKATTGQAPHAFVSRLRLEFAKRMLAYGRQPMAYIAFAAVFSSNSNFSRAFRNATGISPGDYRRNQTGSRSSGALTIAATPSSAGHLGCARLHGVTIVSR